MTTDTAALELVLAEPLPDPEVEAGAGLVLAAFLRPHLRGLHPYLVEHDLPRAVDLMETLPMEARVLRHVTQPHGAQVVAELDGMLICLRTWTNGADCWLSGAERPLLLGLRDRISASVPVPADPLTVEVNFWSQSRSGGMRRSRQLDAPQWVDVREQYPAAVRASMDQLTQHRSSSSAGGRLLLWHGPPGTGKTTAVRSLMQAWRGWADAHYVTDPERLFNSPDYLQSLMFDDDEDARWRLVVVEDAEDFLRRDARAHAGNALGRLLNLSDGILGQGLRTLVLLTSNEEVGDLHPALLRPGRCLARVEFGRLSVAESAAVAGHPVHVELTLAEALERRGTLTRLDVPAPREPVGMYL